MAVARLPLGFLPPPTGSLTGTAGGTIAENASSGAASIRWVVSNAVAPKVVMGTTTLSTSASGNQTVTLGQGSTAVALSDGALSLATVSVSMNCVTGTNWDGNACTRTVAHYTELKLVVFADQGAYIGVVSASGATPLVNNTGYTANAAFPVALCGIWDKLLPDGRPLASCQTIAAGNLRRNFPIDPVKRSLEAEYTGAVPAGAVLRDVGYGASPYAQFNIALNGMYLDAAEGIYYVLNNDMVNLRLTSDHFATNKVIAACSGIQCYQYLVMFSN